MYHPIYKPSILSSVPVWKQRKSWDSTSGMETPSVISIKHISEKLCPQAPKKAGCHIDYDKEPLGVVADATKKWLPYFNLNLEIRSDWHWEEMSVRFVFSQLPFLVQNCPLFLVQWNNLLLIPRVTRYSDFYIPGLLEIQMQHTVYAVAGDVAWI